MRPLLLATLAAGCTPSIEILSPADGDTVCGSPLVVDMHVEGLRLVSPSGDAADTGNGTGHIDVTLNGQDVAMVWIEHAEIANVKDGLYRLQAELSNSDHTPVQPYAGSFVYVTVAEAACDD